MKAVRGVSLASTSAIALAACLFAAPTPALADGGCLAWNAAGSWHLTQSNGTHVTLHLQQTDTHLQGVGEYSFYDNDDEKVRTIGGPVDGQLEQGFRARITVYWSNSTAGQYVGEIQPDGGMSGYTVDVNDPNNKATFVASGSPQCLSRVVAAPAKPTLALGRVHAPAGTPASPPKTMCEMAASARARNSPAAASLEKQCAAQGGALPRVGFGRIPTPPVPAAVVPAAPSPAPAPPEPTPIAPAPAAPAAPMPAAAPGPMPGAAPMPAAAPAAAADALDVLAATGARIAGIDPAVAEARKAEVGAFYALGFDVASGLFGDPALGARGETQVDAEASAIRDSFSAAGQRGFDASAAFHLARDYRR